MITVLLQNEDTSVQRQATLQVYEQNEPRDHPSHLQLTYL
jgi:hypothetical protein